MRLLLNAVLAIVGLVLMDMDRRQAPAPQEQPKRTLH